MHGLLKLCTCTMQHSRKLWGKKNVVKTEDAFEPLMAEFGSSIKLLADQKKN